MNNASGPQFYGRIFWRIFCCCLVQYDRQVILLPLQDTFSLSDELKLRTMPQTKQNNSSRFLLLTGLVAAAAACRLLPPTVNFAPIGAIALFGGACFASKRAAFLVPFAAMLLSDLVLNLTRYADHNMAWKMSMMAYLPFACIVCFGFLMKNRTRNIGALIGGSLGASIIFFLVSNFSWFVAYHPWNLTALLKCYSDAVPFFRGTLASDAIYTALMFGALALVENQAPGVKRELATVKIDNH
jgi:hypothetical protein